MKNDVKSILLVEDSEDDIKLTLRAFKKNNISNRIDVVRDGAAALAWLKNEKKCLPQLILLDLKLPKIDGLDVLKAIRKNKRTKLIPVVILTASREEKDRLHGYLNGANSYIQKPVDFDEFLCAVRELGIYWLLLNVPPPLK